MQTTEYSTAFAVGLDFVLMRNRFEHIQWNTYGTRLNFKVTLESRLGWFSGS